MSYVHLAQNLADAFNALAGQVQILVDQKTILEHKLRFAHEQVQILADRHAPTTSELAETLAKLQLPPHTSVDDNSPVPLPHRKSLLSQHEVAILIRDGRRLAGHLNSLGDVSKTTDSTRESLSHVSRQTSMSTALEHDFTVEGTPGCLQCPFSKAASENNSEAVEKEKGQEDGAVAVDKETHADGTPHKSKDPICAAMNDEAMSQGANGSATGTAAAGKCPIRYMDTHSAEEIAHYVETHKHELPRSHEVCLRRYQRNEDQIRKLDSKYGNLVSMVEGLGHIHQSMLPEALEQEEHAEIERASNERVNNWAHAVSSGATDAEDDQQHASEEVDRQSHFDRPLKEVRVGESPSRPWGISVPVYEPNGAEETQPQSPPPAPVHMPDQAPHHIPVDATSSAAAPKKCPFDHSKLTAFPSLEPAARKLEAESPSPLRAAPQTQDDPFVSKMEPATNSAPPPLYPQAHSQAQPQPQHQNQPAFLNPDMVASTSAGPRMVFTGPVFIGYPVDQAIQILNQYRGTQ